MSKPNYHISKINGIWHVLDRSDNITYHFNCYYSALYAVNKGIKDVKEFKIRFSRRGL